MIDRRKFVFAAATLPTARAYAGHGWEPYDLARPLYLEGEVTSIIWADPHPHLELLHRAGQPLPAGFTSRRIPSQRERVDTARILSATVVAPASAGRFWRVELPTLARLSVWDVRRPRIKDVIGVVGYPGPLVTGTPTLRAEILFIGDKAYPMRSDPA